MDGNIVTLLRWFGLEAFIFVAEPANIFGLVGIFSSQDARNLRLEIIRSKLQWDVTRCYPSCWLLDMQQRLAFFIFGRLLLLGWDRLILGRLLFGSLFRICAIS